MLSCVDGCECEKEEINAHDASNHVSVEGSRALNVTQAEHCEIELRVAEATTSAGHKFKLLGLGVRAPGSPHDEKMVLGGLNLRSNDWAVAFEEKEAAAA